MDPRSRVKRMLEKYQPDKVAQLDAIMTKYAGKEEAFLQSCIKKWGPEPEVSGGGGGGESVPMDTRSRIKRMLEKYQPDKVAQLDAIMKKYAGKEDAFLQSIIKKWGPEPEVAGGGDGGAPMDTRSRIKRMLEKYQPDKVAQLDAIMAKYAGKEDAFLQSIIKKWGPEPEVSGGKKKKKRKARTGGAVPDLPVVAKVWRLYHAKNADKLNTVPALLEKYKGKESELYAKLVEKYQGDPYPAGRPAPDDYKLRITNMYAVYEPQGLAKLGAIFQKYKPEQFPQVLQQLITKKGPEPVPQRAWVDRIRDFYSKYCPEKAGNAQALVDKYGEAKLPAVMQKLVSQYGPEPPEADGGGEEEDDSSDEDEDGEEKQRDNSERGKQKRADKKEWKKLAPEYRAVHEEERDARWVVEDEETSASQALADGEKADRKLARNTYRSRHLESLTMMIVLKLYWRKWMAHLKMRIREERLRQRELLDQRLSVYDQLQTNKHSLRYYEQMEEKRQQEAARRQRKIEEQLVDAAARRRSRSRGSEQEIDFIALNIRQCSVSPGRGRSRSLSPRATSTSRERRQRSLERKALSRPRTPSPGQVQKVAAFRRKWLPPDVTPPEYPSSQLTPTTDASPRSRRDYSQGHSSVHSRPRRFAGGGGRSMSNQPPPQPQAPSTAEQRELQRQLLSADSELFAKALQSATGTPENAVERALRQQRTSQFAGMGTSPASPSRIFSGGARPWVPSESAGGRHMPGMTPPPPGPQVPPPTLPRSTSPELSGWVNEAPVYRSGPAPRGGDERVYRKGGPILG